MTVEEQLAEENQKGYDEGKAIGQVEGMKSAAAMIRERAADLFLASRETEAQELRSVAEALFENANKDNQ